MEFKLLIGLLLVGLGIVVSVFSLGSLIQKNDIILSATLLILGCILMVLGVSFNYRVELDIAKQKIDEEKRRLLEDEKEISKIKNVEDMAISKWRIRDLEYKVKKLESEMANKKDSE